MDDPRIKKPMSEGNSNLNDLQIAGDNENFITKDNFAENLKNIEGKFDHHSKILEEINFKVSKDHIEQIINQTIKLSKYVSKDEFKIYSDSINNANILHEVKLKKIQENNKNQIFEINFSINNLKKT